MRYLYHLKSFLVLSDGHEFHLMLSIDDKRWADWIIPA
jgi:hypothetical protein